MTTTALRPMSTSELLDRTFSLYRNNFLLFAGIAALVPALRVILDIGRAGLGLTPRGAFTPAQLAGFLISLAPTLLVAALGGALASAATVYAVSMVHLGKTATIAGSYKNARPYFGRLLLLFLLISLISIGVTALFVVPLVLAATMPQMVMLFGILATAGGIATLILVVHYYARLSLSVACCVIENIGPVAAIRRSHFLSKGSSGRIWAIILLTGLINGALASSITIPITVIALTAHLTFFVQTVLLSCGAFVAGTLATPIGTIALALVYYDQRVRKEAFDLQLMMEAVGQELQNQAVAATPTPIG